MNVDPGGGEKIPVAWYEVRTCARDCPSSGEPHYRVCQPRGNISHHKTLRLGAQEVESIF